MATHRRTVGRPPHQQPRRLPTLPFCVFGAVFGLFVGFRVVMRTNSPVVFFGGVAAGGVIGGILAARFGWRFWEFVASVGRRTWW